MSTVIDLLSRYGLWIVFANVLAAQAGLPLPAVPTLVVAGALIGGGHHTAASLLAVAVAASLVADSGWYVAGQRVGRPVLRLLCRVSLSPDTCVRRTESIYARFGPPSLVVAKFIPGFAAVATALAGAVRTRFALFVLFDAMGAALWAGVAILVGWIFRDAIDELLATLTRLGEIGVALVVVALLAFVGFKWWDRQRFFKELRMARVTVEELSTMLEAGTAPMILDVRSPWSQREEGRIPGAILVDDSTLEIRVPDVEANREVIVYCACPNEASAARIAKLLKARGFARVRPLAGGIDAWAKAGYAVDRGEGLAAPLDKKDVVVLT